MIGRAARHRRDADLGRLAERLERRDGGLARTGRAAVMKRLMAGACAPRSASTGVAWSAKRAEAHHRRAQLAQEARQPLRCRPRARRGARRSPRPPRPSCRAPRTTRRRSRASGASTVSPSTASCSQRLVLGGEDLEDLVDLLERRVGAADDLVEVARRGRRRRCRAR